MAVRPTDPNLIYDKQRRATIPGAPAGNLQGNDLNELINNIRRAGHHPYPNMLAVGDNLASIAKKDIITPSTQALVDMIGVNSKAKFLRDLIDNTQKQLAEETELFIPVVGAVEVNKAIARLYPKSSPQSDKIFWNIWVDVVRNKIMAGNVLGSELLEQLSGNNIQDNQVIQDSLNANEIRRAHAIDNRKRTMQGQGQSGAGPTPLDQGMLRRESEQDSDTALLIELLAYGASLVLLYFLDRKLEVYKAPKSQQIAVSSTMFPNPAGTIVMIIQIIIGLALHFLIEGLLASQVKTTLDGIDIPGVTEKDKQDIIKAAQELAEGGAATVGPLAGKTLEDPEIKSAIGFKDGVLDAVKSYFYRADFDLIYEYGESWLAANANAFHIKGDFTQWLLLPELESMIYNMDNMIEQAPNYSELFYENAMAAGEKPAVSKPVSNAIDLAYIDFNNQIYQTTMKDILANSKESPEEKRKIDRMLDAGLDSLKDKFNPEEMRDLLLSNIQSQNCANNDLVDRLGAILTNDPFIASAMCCFVRYFGAMDLKMLYSLQAVLKIFSKGIVFDLGNFLNTISTNIYDDLFRRARTALMAQLNRVFKQMFEDVLKWVDAESIDFLTTCLPIDGLIRFAVSSMLDAQLALEKMISEYVDLLKVELYALDSKISILAEQRWAKSLYLVIDALIKVGQDANSCQLTGNPFTDKPTRTLIESLLNDPNRQQGAVFYNELLDFVSNNPQSWNAPYADQAEISKGGLNNTLEGVQLTKIVRYTPAIRNNQLRALLDQPSVFNTFADNDGFYTEHGIKIDSIIKNLNNEEANKLTVAAAIKPENMASCFDNINQTELLKLFFGKING